MTAQGRGRQVELSWSFSAHARRLLTLALSGLAVAVITQRPAFAAAAAPAMVLLAAWRRDRICNLHELSPFHTPARP